MKHLTFSLLFATCAFAPWVASAQEAATPAQAMPAWEQLTPAQRELLIAPVRDRWNREPDKRPQFMAYAQRWKTMPAPQQDRARRGIDRWEGMSPEQREHARAMFHAMRGMDKEARHAFMAQWRQMTPQQRNEWLRTHPLPKQPAGQ